MHRLLLVSLACTGCSAIFGLSTQPTDGDASATPTITVVPLHTFAHDLADGTPTTEVVPFAPGSGSVRVRVDGAPVDVSLDADGRIVFAAPIGARLAASFADLEVQAEVTGDATFTLPFPVFGHPDAKAPAAGTYVDLAPITPLPREAFTPVFTGTWQSSATTYTMISLATVVPFADTEPRLPGVGDRIYLLGRPDPDDATYAYDWVGHAAATGIVDGAEVTIPIDGTSRALDRCATTEAIIGRELARFDQLPNHDEFPTVAGTFEAIASPAPALAAEAGPCLARIAASSDGPLRLAYANLLDHAVLLRLAGSIITPSDPALGDGFSFVVNEVADPLAACASYTFGTTEVALPSLPSLGGVALDRDNLTVAFSQDLTWEIASDGAVDAYEVAVYDVDFARVVATIYTRERRAVLSAARLPSDPSRTYAISIRAIAGLPGVTSGDFATIGYPFATTRVTSSTFHVM